MISITRVPHVLFVLAAEYGRQKGYRRIPAVDGNTLLHYDTRSCTAVWVVIINIDSTGSCVLDKYGI